MELSHSDLSSVSLSNEPPINDSCAESCAAEKCDSSSSITRAKSKSPKGSPPNVLNRLTSQIKKPPHRKTSPILWLPRKKGDTYLSRKIKLLQEAGGMNDTLGETLGHSNPHYCRVEREKMAAKEAARAVMNARKAAMVEASWCRILQASRIPTKEAEALVSKAEKEVTEALETANSKGVIMYETPDRAFKHLEIHTSSVEGKGSATTTHTVKAAIETAFEVDKQVAAAVKTAFTRLAHCSSCNKDEFKELLRRISENPENQELSEFNSLSEVEIGYEDDDDDDRCSSQRKSWKKLSPRKFSGTMLVDMMFKRLKCLKEDELASLATIVATCGLNAALNNTENHHKGKSKVSSGSLDKFRQVESELPSLNKFLVKKLTRLEREVQEARKARKDELNNHKASEGSSNDDNDKFNAKSISLVEAQDSSSKPETQLEGKGSDDMGKVQKHGKCSEQDIELPNLENCLVKHVSRLEREIQEAKDRRRNGQMEKENVNSNGNQDENVPPRLDEVVMKKKDAKQELDKSGAGGLDQILVKHKSRLEREKIDALKEKPVDGVSYSMSRRQAREKELLETWGGIGLGAIRPHVSRLERDKAAWRKAEEEEKRATLLQEQQ